MIQGDSKQQNRLMNCHNNNNKNINNKKYHCDGFRTPFRDIKAKKLVFNIRVVKREMLVIGETSI